METHVPTEGPERNEVGSVGHVLLRAGQNESSSRESFSQLAPYGGIENEGPVTRDFDDDMDLERSWLWPAVTSNSYDSVADCCCRRKRLARLEV